MTSVDVPKPVPVTVKRVPPELPVEGETDTRVGVTVIVDTNSAYPAGKPSGK